jgi:hypothetical protein
MCYRVLYGRLSAEPHKWMPQASHGDDKKSSLMSEGIVPVWLGSQFKNASLEF